MNRRHYFLIIIVPILFLVIISPVGRTAAVGSGCRNFQRYGVLAFPSFGPITLQFDKGDTIQIFNSSPYDVSAPSIASGVTGLYTYTFPATGSYQIAAATNPSIAATWGTGCIGANVATNTVTSLHFTDGRVNDHDGAETAAVYCEKDGGVTIYAVIDSVGYLAFKVTKDELASVPAKPAKNTLIKSGLGVSLYRLTTGELQINAPDKYVFIWDGCPA